MDTSDRTEVAKRMSWDEITDIVTTVKSTNETAKKLLSEHGKEASKIKEQVNAIEQNFDKVSDGINSARRALGK
ncbi:hypothetical protein LA080_011833 [Diaporthe eres]|nr:hypothetical protein LA080_011833 [Diaporthe eres]